MKRGIKITACIGIVLVGILMVSSAMAFELICRSEEMVAKSPCDVAGSMRMIFDKNDHDLIRDYLAAGNHYVLLRATMSGTDVSTDIVLPTLCRDIKGISVVAGVPHSGELMPLVNNDIEVSDNYTEAGAVVPDVLNDVTAYIWGQKGNQSFEIYITAMQEATAAVWADRNNWPWIRVGQSSERNIAADTTAICVDIAEQGDRPGFERNAKLIVSLNNEPRELTYTTSDNQIGHFYDSVVSQIDCKGKQVGNIVLGKVDEGEQVGTCRNFDNEDETGAGNAGYCTGTHFSNKLILQSAATFIGGAEYQISAQILVNGIYGDRGVYFSNQAVRAATYGNKDNACDGVGTVFVGNNTAAANGSTENRYTYLRADGNVATPLAPVYNQCAIAVANRATSMTTDSGNFITAGNSFLYIDLPAFNYDLKTVESIIASEGHATVTIQYTVFETPCGTLLSGEHEIGTFGCAAVTTCMYFPYVFKGQSPWQCGIALSYIKGEAMTAEDINEMEATFTFHAPNGNVYTYVKNDFTTASWAAMLDDTTQFKFSPTPPNGVGWLEVSANFRIDGFQFVTDSEFGGTTQPRVLNRCNNYDGWK